MALSPDQPLHSGQPVEFIWAADPDKATRITEFAGYDLTFDPDPRYLTVEGKARRIEWIADPTVVRQLLDPGYYYNRGGQPPMFRIAQDLLQAEQNELFASHIKSAAAGVFATAEQLEDVVERATDNELAVKTILAGLGPMRTQIKELQEQVAALQGRRKPGPKGKDGDADDATAEDGGR